MAEEVARLAVNCENSVINTRPITSQIAIVLNELFKTIP